MSDSPRTDAEEIAGRAVHVECGEWTPFDDHYFTSCCGCGLTHKVVIKREGDGHGVRFYRLDDVTEIIRGQHEFSVLRELSQALSRVRELEAERERLGLQVDYLERRIVSLHILLSDKDADAILAGEANDH